MLFYIGNMILTVPHAHAFVIAIIFTIHVSLWLRFCCDMVDLDDHFIHT